MNKKIFFLIIALQPLIIRPDTSQILTDIINFPPEVALKTASMPLADGSLQLSQERIDQLRTHYERNFNIRHYLSYGSAALTTVLIGVGLYQMGLLNFLLPDIIPATPKIDPKDFASELARLKDEITQLKAANVILPPSSRLASIASSIKGFGSWIVFGMITAKALQIKNYVEVKPRISWFLSTHSLTDRINILRKSVQAITDFNIPAHHSLAYHARAIMPAQQGIIHTLEEFIAFIDYYFDMIEPDVLASQGLDLLPRFLLNTSNDFFNNLNAVLKDGKQNTSAVALIDAFKSELVAMVTKCTLFEKDFIEKNALDLNL
jgi:hypothetical protein